MGFIIPFIILAGSASSVYYCIKSETIKRYINFLSIRSNNNNNNMSDCGDIHEPLINLKESISTPSGLGVSQCYTDKVGFYICDDEGHIINEPELNKYPIPKKV
jgi:hypothetical protein